MGSFPGHVLPGSFFLVFGVWWTVQISIRYFRARYHKGPAYHSSATFPCSCLCGKLATWEVEGFLKIAVTTISIIGEMIYEIHNYGRPGLFAHGGHSQHYTMFFIFWLAGLVDILVHHKVPLPKNSQYVVSVVAFGTEGILFNFHLHGRSPLDVQVHSIALYVTIINCLTLLAEMRWPKNVLCAYARAYFVILQGTWLCQVAFILYNPVPHAVRWDQHDHDQMMIAMSIFAWHVILNLIFMLVTSLVISCIVRRGAPSAGVTDDEVALAQLIKKDVNGQTFVSLNEESDSDMEYERLVHNGNKN